MPHTRLPGWVRRLATRLGLAAAAGTFSVAGAPPAGITGTPLPARPLWQGTGGHAPRFEPVDAAGAGLTFADAWTPPTGYRLRVYQSLPGGGVCIGDYDLDGWPDVFLSQPNVGSGLYRNLGGFRFEDATATAGLPAMPEAQGAAFADLDNDGDLDLFVCNDSSPNQLFVNQGDGTFARPVGDHGLGFSGASVMMAFADYDLDGDLDGYLVTYRSEPPEGQDPQPVRGAHGGPVIRDEDAEFLEVVIPEDGRPRIIKAAQRDRLYRNRGDGTFEEVSAAAGIGGTDWGLAATWWDYDRDGWPDLYVSNDFYSPDRLSHNNRDGTFTDRAPEAIPHAPWYSMGADSADLDNDGWPELMASDMSGTSHYKQKASMGDMGDTAWFLVHPEPRQYMRNALYGNTGAGRFRELAALAGVANTDWTWSLKFADLDEDGWCDLYVTNGMNRDWTNTDLRRVADEARTPEAKMQVWLESPQRRDANLVFRNRGDGDIRFENLSDDWGLGAEVVSYGAAYGDFDRDGDLDLVVNNAESSPGLYRNHTSASHRVVLRLEGASSNRWGLGATVTVDTASGRQVRFLNSAQGYMSSNEPIVHFGLGGDPTLDRLEVRWPSGHIQEFAGLAADHHYTLREPEDPAPGPTASGSPADPLYVETGALARVTHRETPFNDFARQPLLPNQHSQLGPGMAWGDPDRDGDADVFLGGAADQPGQLWLNDGQGAFSQAPAGSCGWLADAVCEDMGAVFIDTDADGDDDRFVVSGGVECEPGDEVLRDRLYLNDGSGRFTKAGDGVLPDLRDSGGPVAAADYDRDGDLDIFVGGRVVPGRYPLAPASRLLRNDGGRFTDATANSAPDAATAGMVTSAVWSDSDGDGWVDLLAAYEWGPVRLFLNRGGVLTDATGAAGLAGVTGWFNSITPADLDRDGDTDYVVGNWGWNTKYHASPEKPALLYYGDFANDGQMQLVEAEFEDETLFPVRGKSCSTNAMPFLAEKFERFHDFASASLGEIYSEPALQGAHRFAANTLDSGVWLNGGDGGFQFVPLPAAAQVAPVFGSAVWDVDGDGVRDLFLAQNFFGPQAETGRHDGGVGLLLRGIGDGTFRAWPARDSGIVIPGDAGAAALVDLDHDGQPELTVATNDGPCFSFARNPRVSDLPAQRWVHVSGRPGNPHGIGTRLTATFADGSRSTAEIVAGGGYLSQAPPSAEVSLAGDELVRLEAGWPDGTVSAIDLTRGLPEVIQQP